MSTDLVDALRRQGLTDVDDSALAKSLYASDAGIYRIAPQVVVRPREVEEIAATLAVARETGVPLTMRGAGTSIAGNAIGAGIVVDTSRHLNRVLELDPEARTALVQPGAVHATLQRLAVPQGLRFGPDPSTHTRCTIGGMIGNNACGSRALGYGRTVDNVQALTVLLADGSVVSTGRDPQSAPAVDRLNALVDEHLGTVRTEFGRFGRQVSGYSFEQLLPERDRRFDRFLVGTEGTLGLVLDATIRLVEDAPARALAVLGYPSMAEAADAVPALLDAPDRRLRGTRPAHRRAGPQPPGAARGCRLAVRRGDRRDGRRGGGQGPGRGAHRRSAAPHRDRHRRAARAVADPRGRCRPRRALAEPPRPGRVGGQRGAAREARRLPARLRRPAQAAPPRRCALRPLRRRVRARAHRLRARERLRPRDLPQLRRAGGRPRRLLRRLDVGRARRRSCPLRAAAADVLAGGDRPDAAGQADPGPRQPAQPRRAGRPGAVRRRPAAGRPPAPRPYDAPARPRRRVVLRGGAPVHRRGQVPRRQHRQRRRDVPVVPRHPGGEGLHPRPRPRAPGRLQRRPRLRRPGRGRRPRPVPVVQGLRQRLPHRHRHGDVQVRGAVPEVRRGARLPAPARARTTPSASSRGGPG